MQKIKTIDYGSGDTLCCPTCNEGYLHVVVVDHNKDDVSIAYDCETCGEQNILEIHNFKGNKTIGWYNGQ
jgi:transcription elongation factor Elf1